MTHSTPSHSVCTSEEAMRQLRGRQVTRLMLHDSALIIDFDLGERLTFWFHEPPKMELELPERNMDS